MCVFTQAQHGLCCTVHLVFIYYLLLFNTIIKNKIPALCRTRIESDFIVDSDTECAQCFLMCIEAYVAACFATNVSQQ